MLAAILAMSTWSFVKPANVRAEVRLAPVGDFQLGSVTPYRIDEDRLLAMGQLATYFGSSSHGAASSVLGDTLLYVVRLPDGDFRVLSGRSTHLGQVIEWKPDFVPEVGKIRGAFFGWGGAVRSGRSTARGSSGRRRATWTATRGTSTTACSSSTSASATKGRRVPAAKRPA